MDNLNDSNSGTWSSAGTNGGGLKITIKPSRLVIDPNRVKGLGDIMVDSEVEVVFSNKPWLRIAHNYKGRGLSVNSLMHEIGAEPSFYLWLKNEIKSFFSEQEN